MAVVEAGYVVTWAERHLACQAGCGCGWHGGGATGYDPEPRPVRADNPVVVAMTTGVLPECCGLPMVLEWPEFRQRIPDLHQITCGHCGGTFDHQAWTGHDIECPTCGQPFNCWGQQLERNRALWDGTDGAYSPDYE